jgi:hypothetical protein
MTVTKPASMQADDIIIAIGASNAGAWTVPSGFNQFTVSTDSSFGSTSYRVYGWWYRVTGSEGASFSFSSSTAASNGAPMAVSMIAWRGVDTTSPVADLSTDADQGNASEPPNPATAFTQSVTGRLMFARAARSSTSLQTFSTSTSGWAVQDQVNIFSGGSTRYAIGHVTQTADTGTGNRVEPAVSASPAADDSQNFYILATLKAAVDPTTGTMDMTTPSLSNAGTVFAGTMTTPSGTLDMQTPSLTVTMDGIAAPPSGSLSMQVPSITADFSGNSIGGSFGMQVPSITSDFEAGVEPLGPISVTLPMLDVGFTVETTPFGGNVIRPEHESRAFRVIDPDPGLTYLKHRSQVTDA